MQRVGAILTVLLWLGLTLLTSLASAQSKPRTGPSAPITVKPFGDLAWDDSFSSAVQKIKRWPGIAQCYVSYSNLGLIKHDLLPIQSGPDLARVPEQILGLGSTSLGRLITPGQSKLPRHRDWQSGQEWAYSMAANSFNFKILANSVSINGVPFELSVSFTSAPGAILYLQKNVTMSSGNVLIPLVISSVSLSSHSKALNQKGKSIEALLREKYGTQSGKDAQGNGFSYTFFSENFSIGYRSSLPDRLSKLYNQYLTKQAVQDGQFKPDLSDGL